MNPPLQNPPGRHSVLRRLLIGAGLCLTPFVILAIVAASYLTLDRDATVLREQMMMATGNVWNTKVQMSFGQATINAVDFGLGFVRKKSIADAHLALAAVRRASVGVYERSASFSVGSQKPLFTGTDRIMQLRGWSRLVGVVEGNDLVLIYVPHDMNTTESVKMCLAVVSGKELVVASLNVDTPALAELVKHHSFDDARNRLHLASCLPQGRPAPSRVCSPVRQG